MDVVDRIEKAGYDRATKIIRLWAVVQLNYRQPLGDKAREIMERITDGQIVTAISFLTGFAMGMSMDRSSHDQLKHLVPELKEVA